MGKRNEDIITREEIIQLIKRTGVPVLILDKKWLDIFSTDEKSNEIAYLQEKVNEALKMQGHINTKREELLGLKKTLLKGIVTNMDALEDSRVEKKVAKSRDLIQDINDQLVLLEDKELDAPGNLKTANANLAFRSIEEIFDRHEKNIDDIESLEKWIEEARIELKKRILLRENKIEENERFDKFIYSTFAPEVIYQYRKYRELN